MPESHEQLEQELISIWQRAANTSQVSSQNRIDNILRRSRTEISVRDLLKFASYLLTAFFQLYSAVLHTLFTTPRKSVYTPEQHDYE